MTPAWFQVLGPPCLPYIRSGQGSDRSPALPRVTKLSGWRFTPGVSSGLAE